MTYGDQSRTADRSTRTRPTSTPWQRERMSGPILPMDTPHKGWLYRVMGR